MTTVHDPERSPRSDGEASRQRLLRAGLNLFARQGYAKTSTRELAEAAGVNVQRAPIDRAVTLVFVVAFRRDSPARVELKTCADSVVRGIDQILYFCRRIGESTERSPRAIAHLAVPGTAYAP